MLLNLKVDLRHSHPSSLQFLVFAFSSSPCAYDSHLLNPGFTSCLSPPLSHKNVFFQIFLEYFFHPLYEPSLTLLGTLMRDPFLGPFSLSNQATSFLDRHQSWWILQEAWRWNQQIRKKAQDRAPRPTWFSGGRTAMAFCCICLPPKLWKVGWKRIPNTDLKLVGLLIFISHVILIFQLLPIWANVLGR